MSTNYIFPHSIMVSEPKGSSSPERSSTLSTHPLPMAINYSSSPSYTISDIPHLKNQLQFMSVKLDNENFLIWKKQIVPLLDSHELSDYHHHFIIFATFSH
ncbi:hypothetical protein Dimus_038973 [Dionaea muscipula]